MKVATTIQITQEEDREISQLKKKLGFKTKKAVVLEGLKSLAENLQNKQRRIRLQQTSLRVRDSSSTTNKEWALYSTALQSR